MRTIPIIIGCYVDFQARTDSASDDEVALRPPIDKRTPAEIAFDRAKEKKVSVVQHNTFRVYFYLIMNRSFMFRKRVEFPTKQR